MIWIDAKKELPDDDLTVLISMADGEVWTGYFDNGLWRFVSGDPAGVTVTHWMDFPEPPKDAA